MRAFADDPVAVRRTGLSTAADAFVLNAPLLGAIGLGLLVVYLLCTAERATTEAAAVYACAARAVGEFVLSAYGRQNLGLDQATESRYGYIAIVLLAPAVAMALDRVLHRVSSPFRAVFVVVFLMLVSREPGASSQRRDRTRRRVSNRSASAILAAAQIANDPRRSCTGASRRAHYSPDLTVADLRRFGANGELPALHPRSTRS